MGRSLMLVSNARRVSLDLMTWRNMPGYTVGRSLMHASNVRRVSLNLGKVNVWCIDGWTVDTSVWLFIGYQPSNLVLIILGLLMWHCDTFRCNKAHDTRDEKVGSVWYWNMVVFQLLSLNHCHKLAYFPHFRSEIAEYCTDPTSSTGVLAFYDHGKLLVKCSWHALTQGMGMPPLISWHYEWAVGDL